MRSLEQVNLRTNVRTYVLTYIRTGQTLYPLHNFVVRGDNNRSQTVYGETERAPRLLLPIDKTTIDGLFIKTLSVCCHILFLALRLTCIPPNPYQTTFTRVGSRLRFILSLSEAQTHSLCMKESPSSKTVLGVLLDMEVAMIRRAHAV